ncbi:MAG: hypothetical protein WC696_01450 [Candidatus Methylopumilus sp.]|jgi:hypothetical protein
MIEGTVTSVKSPLAITKALPRRKYSQELKEVTALFTGQALNPSLIKAVSNLDNWLSESSNSKDFIGTSEASRLLRGNVTGLQILTEGIAILAHATRNPSMYPSNEVLTEQITTAILRLAPRDEVTAPATGYIYRKPCSKATKAAVGFHFRSLLDIFYKLITHGQTFNEKPKTPLVKLLAYLKGFSLRKLASV